jgi:hypothetical protein
MPELFRAAKVAPMTPGWPLLEDAALAAPMSSGLVL